MFEIVSKEVIWSVWGSYQTIWGPPLPNVTRHSGWWPHTVTPSIDRTLHQFLTITDLDFYYRIWHFTLLCKVSIEHMQQVRHANRGRLLLWTIWSCPTFGRACVLMSIPISPELVLSPDFWKVSSIPRYFSIALQYLKHSNSKYFHFKGIIRKSVFYISVHRIHECKIEKVPKDIRRA